MTNGNQQPKKKFHAGAVRAAVWQNARTLPSGQSLQVMSVTIDRTYKDKEGNWQNTGSLPMNDIPKAILVLTKAYEFALSGKAGEDAEESDDGDAK
jgi:hypothetical protein